MNVRASKLHAVCRFALCTRVVAAVAVCAIIVLIGYTAPVAEVAAEEPVGPAETYDNGPTGYFPDMFTAPAPDDMPQHVEAF